MKQARGKWSNQAKIALHASIASLWRPDWLSLLRKESNPSGTSLFLFQRYGISGSFVDLHVILGVTLQLFTRQWCIMAQLKIFLKAMSLICGKSDVKKACTGIDRTPPRTAWRCVDQRAGCVGCGLGLFSCKTWWHEMISKRSKSTLDPGDKMCGGWRERLIVGKADTLKPNTLRSVEGRSAKLR